MNIEPGTRLVSISEISEVDFFEDGNLEIPARHGVIPANTIVEVLEDGWARVLYARIMPYPALFKIDVSLFRKFE